MFLKKPALRLEGLVITTVLAVGTTLAVIFHRLPNQAVSLLPSSIPSRPPNSSSSTTEAPTSERLMAMRYTVLSKIPDGMGSAMAQNLWNDSMPQGKAIRWLAEEDGLEVDPLDSEVLVQRYALAVIFYATGGDTWIDKARFLS